MRKERGSVTIITLTTVLFMIAFLVSTFTIMANRRQAQEEVKRETKNIYEADVENIDGIYESYFAEEDAVIPIYTADELLQMGTGVDIVINDKIYTFSSTKSYKLMVSIELDASEYSEKYPSMFQTVDGVQKWIGIEAQLPDGTFDYNEKRIIEVEETGTDDNT